MLLYATHSISNLHRNPTIYIYKWEKFARKWVWFYYRRAGIKPRIIKLWRSIGFIVFIIIYIYIYRYRERQRQRQRKTERKKERKKERRSWGVMANVLVCGLEVSMFKLQPHYYVHFRTNSLGKGMNPFYSPSYRLNSIIAVSRMNFAWNNPRRLICH